MIPWSLRSVGSIKLQVCFAKEPLKRDYILQKRPVILRRRIVLLQCHDTLVATVSGIDEIYRSLLENIVSVTGLFCTKDL